MNTLIGLIIIAIGSLGQSSSYVPIKKVKQWSWESFWLVQGIFAWLVFPLLGALLAIPAGSNLFQLLSSGCVSYRFNWLMGVLWGVGGFDLWDLSMRVTLGSSLWVQKKKKKGVFVLGGDTCAGFEPFFLQ